MMSQKSVAWTQAPRMLKQLRDIMAGSGTARERLNRIVGLIAFEMITEVCSVYVMQPGEILQLAATKGLKTEAVNHTRLRIGEGLVGYVAALAAPMAVSDAQAHPAYAYRPETGEEIYHSFLGVPLLRDGRVLGVVVVQNQAHRHYSDEDVEVLETVAMVTTELVASGELRDLHKDGSHSSTIEIPHRLSGQRLVSGIGLGQVALYQWRVVIRNMVAEDPQAELDRLESAFETLHAVLNVMIEEAVQMGGVQRDILEAYGMFARDRGWMNRIREAIRSGLTAEGAVQKVQNDTRARMGQIQDSYFRARLADLENLNNRLLQHLCGDPVNPTSELPDGPLVVVALDMGPADLLEYDRSRLQGVVLEEGSAAGHLAIVAKAMEIPVVGRIRGILAQVDAGDPIIVDGDTGQVFLHPAEEVTEQYELALKARAQQKAEYRRTRDLPAMTRDGVEISLKINAGLPLDLRSMIDVGGEEVGLFRTEIPFMVRPTYPNIEEQRELYAQAFDAAEGRLITFRTLDIGGDKRLPYFPQGRDANPAMGWRSLRICLDQPHLLREQIRAMLLAARGRPFRLMFPMVAEVREFDQALRIVNLELERARNRRIAIPTDLAVGVMFEIPSLFWQMDHLLRKVGFVSIGTNDLFQFVLAADRNSVDMENRYDSLSPALLRMLKSIADQCDAANVPLTLCGEMGGRPMEAMVLVGLGFRSLSMPASSIGPVKRMIRSLDLGQVQRFTNRIINLGCVSVRGPVKAFAKDFGVLT